MSQNDSPRLSLPYIIASQAQKEVTHNETINLLDLLLQPVIKSRTNTPPTTPSEGDAYIVIATATGIWIGKEKQVAWYINGGWRFIVPSEGMWFWSVADGRDYVYHNENWLVK